MSPVIRRELTLRTQAKKVVNMRVGVVGLGTAGAAASLFLKRAGHDVRVFERFASPRPVGSGILLQMTGMAVLQNLGILDGVLDRGAIIDRL